MGKCRSQGVEALALVRIDQVRLARVRVAQATVCAYLRIEELLKLQIVVGHRRRRHAAVTSTTAARIVPEKQATKS